MAGTTEGRIRQTCKKHGFTFDEYMHNIASGLKWCHKCASWVSVKSFNKDATRFDGLTAKCHGCTRVKVRRTTKGMPSPHKGKKMTPEKVQKMLAKQRANGRVWKGAHGKRTGKALENIRAGCNKRHHPRGPEHRWWKGGNKTVRDSTKIKEWRTAVFTRDNFTCQDCGDDRGGNLHAHHIKPFAKYIKLRYVLSNGITLCEICHEKRHFNPNSTRNRARKRQGIPLKFEPLCQKSPIFNTSIAA